ncbi:MAG: F0F1 ATP synthase subunit B [Candidatus Nomurabacteria bacterium]|nr:F0F1 ATP synthase subunit B [Candidatus Nomurabacteria bacterium]
MNEFIATFHIDWKLMIAQLINFGIVFLAFYLLAAKPLSKLMKERGETISKGIDDAKINAEVLEKTSKEYEAVLSKARIEANKIFQDGKKEAETKKTAMLEEAKKEMKTMIENGKKSLEIEKVKMVEEAKKEIVSLAMKATEKLMGSKQDLNNL